MKCALIGLGMVADTHVAACHASKRVSLHGVYGRDVQKTWAFAARHGGLVAYDNMAQLANDPELDFVILATPPDARLEFVDALARAGKPILLEKPMDRTWNAAKRLFDICAEHSVPLGIVFQHRARAASRALKQMIEAGSLGDIAHIDMRVPWWRDQSYYDVPGRGTYARDGGGVLITQAIHTLDLGLWLCGRVKSVQAMMRRTPLHHLEAEDWASATFEFENGAFGTLTATTAAFPGAAESLTLQGTKASAHLEGGVLKVSYLDGTTSEIGEFASTGGGADPMAFTHDWHQTIIEDFALTLTQGTPQLSPAEDGLHVHAVLDAIRRAADSNRMESVT